MAYANSCIKPAYDYYTSHLNAPLMSVPLRAFKVARLFVPHKLKEMKPDISAINDLAIFPFLQEPASSFLKDEFPLYQGAAEDINSDYDPLEFWKAHTA